MNSSNPLVQIGPVCDDPAESVSSVNKAFLEGLDGSYQFVAPSANRKHGGTRQARFNAWNVYYLIKHAVCWLWALAWRRPAVAHYGITTGWALEKGLLFLRVARLFGAKTVGHLHSGEFVACWNALSDRRKQFAARSLERLDAFVVLSEYWRGIVSEIAGIPQSKLFVVNNPIAREFEESALEMPVERSENIILSLGVMGRDKGVLDIVAAADLVQKRFSDFKLQLAGPEREPGILSEVTRRIGEHSLGERIQILPGVWGDAKIVLFREASIFVLPSYAENFPLVVLEAAAAGHAIISTPVGAVPEFFEDGVSALFVEPGNAQQLAQAITRLLESPDERNRLARAAREVFLQRLGRTRIMASLDDVYAYVLQSSHLAARSEVKSASGAEGGKVPCVRLTTDKPTAEPTLNTQVEGGL